MALAEVDRTGKIGFSRMKTPSPFALSFTAFVLFVFAALPAKAGTAPDELVGSTWLVEDVEGGGVIDFLQSTLTFESAEKVAGMGGCNNFFGSVKIDGSMIEFGPLGATRKACGEAIDDQEFRFLQALEKVRSFEFDQGLLFLLDNDGAQVLRLSRKS
jgi:heat shock protein HslJ